MEAIIGILMFIGYFMGLVVVISLIGGLYQWIVKSKPHKEWQAKRQELINELKYFDLDLPLDSYLNVYDSDLESRYKHKRAIEALSGRESAVDKKYKRIKMLIKQERDALERYES